jgi:hypothetical protein
MVYLRKGEAMKAPKRQICCARCGVRMLPDEVLLCQKGDICGFCENMHAEALQIYQNRLNQSNLKVIVKLHAVAQHE